MTAVGAFGSVVRGRRRCVVAGVAALLAAGVLVPVAASPAAAQTPASVDYDVDDDGLIEISSLAHLNAVRWDLDGDGTADVYPPDKDGVTGHDLDGAAKHAAAFADAVAGMGCPAGGCAGYELIADLDFDTNGSGGADSGDDYWNGGKGWVPLIGGEAIYGHNDSSLRDQVGTSYYGDRPNSRARMFTGVFEGNGRTIANLYINDAGRYYVGLFGYIGPGAKVRNFGLTAPNSDSGVRGDNKVGALAGLVERARVSGVYSHLDVTGVRNVGGLVGVKWRYSSLIESYATGDVAGDLTVGGLVGLINDAGVTASYATGDVTVGCREGGGLMGWRGVGYVRATYATGSVTITGGTGDDCARSYYEWKPFVGMVGGLIGWLSHPEQAPWIRANYATGSVSATTQEAGRLGGLTGGCRLSVRPRADGANYWDVEASGMATSPDCGVGYTTAQLQAPTGYTGIYADWNLPVPVGDYYWRFNAPGDDPWDFGTSSQYPVLKYCAAKPGIQTADGQPYCPLQPDMQRSSGVPGAQSVPVTPEVGITGSVGGSEGDTVSFTLTAAPAPAADLVVGVSVVTSGDFGYGPVPATVTIPAGGTATVSVTTSDDSADEPDGSVTLSVDAGSGYTVSATQGTAAVDVADDDAPLPGSAQDGPALDAQLLADVRGYAAEVRHGTLHVNRWKRVLEAFGVEDYAGLEPTTLDEARVHVDIGRPRWVPVLAHMAAVDAVSPQPPPARGSVQVDAQLLASARAKAGETHRGARHVNRWKRVLEAFGDGDYPGVEPLTAAGAQVYANVWSGWTEVAAQLRLIEAAAGADPAPVVPPVVVADPVVSITAGSGVSEGGDAVFTVAAVPPPAAGLAVSVTVAQSGDFGAATGSRTVTVPSSGSVSFAVGTSDDSADEPDGSVTATVDAGSGYTVSATQGTGTVDVADDDDAPLPGSAQDGPPLDAQLLADVRGYAAETRHGTLHVNRWKRVLEAFGVEDYAGLEPTTLDEARVHVDIGRSRWVPVLAHMAAMDAADPQPPPARGSVQVDAQLLATARAKAGETHGGARHVNRWKRVLEAFGDADYPDIEPLTAAGAQVYANVWPAWTGVAAQIRLIEAAATTDPPPVVVPPVVIPPVVVPATPEVNIAGSAGGTEGVTVTFTLTATPAPAADLDVGVSVAASGDFGYGSIPATVTIPTGGTATVTVTTADDSTDEPDGTVTLTIDPGSGYTVGAYGSETADVTDDDDPVAPVVVVPDPQVSITAGADVTEGASATFTVTASPAPATDLDVAVTVAQSGAFGAATGTRTVTIPTGGSVSFAVATSDDSADEPDGSVTATVGAGSGYTVSATRGAGTVAVADDDVPIPVVSITAGQGVTEGGSATFTLTASPAPAADLDVAVTVAQSGDFGAATGSRTVTVPTGGSVSFAVATSDDSADEPDGSVTATVDAGSGYTVSNTQGAGTVAVADNDVPPPPSSVTVSVGDASGSEYDWVVEFTVTLSEASSQEVRVWFETSNWRGLTGRAKMGLDYWSTQTTVVFAPGQTEQTVSVWLVDDSRSEPEEYFTVELRRPRGAAIEEGKGTATGTITDDD